MSKPQIFLSYCHDNTAETNTLRKELLANGLDVWWDDMILPGQDWKLEIRKAMKRSAAVVLCLSKEAEARTTSGIYPEAFDAIETYRTYKPGAIFLIPVRFSECEMPHIQIDATRSLESLQYVDLFPLEKRADGVKRLIDALGKALPPAPEQNAEEPADDVDLQEKQPDSIEQPRQESNKLFGVAEHRYAVLIGNATFPSAPKLQTLQAPQHDVDDLNAVLTMPDRGQFDQSIMLNNEPHYEAEKKINQTLGKARKDDFVLIYYSGHGKLNRAGHLYLASYNTDLEALESTSISAETIKKCIEVSACNRIVLILDCCFGGAFSDVIQRSSVDDRLQLLSKVRSTFIMTSATDIQTATEKEGERNSVFTKHLIEGIKTGEADRNGDGLITMDELYHYVHERVQKESSQEPMEWSINVKGADLVIAKSGRQPRTERAQRIGKLLFDLKIPTDIIRTALDISDKPVSELSEHQHDYDQLLERMIQDEITPTEFVYRWSQVPVTPPTPEEENNDSESEEAPSKVEIKPHDDLPDDEEENNDSESEEAPSKVETNPHDDLPDDEEKPKSRIDKLMKHWFLEPLQGSQALGKLIVTQLSLYPFFIVFLFCQLILSAPFGYIFGSLTLLSTVLFFSCSLLLGISSWREHFHLGALQGLVSPIAAWAIVYLGVLIATSKSVITTAALWRWNTQITGTEETLIIIIFLVVSIAVLTIVGLITLSKSKLLTSKTPPEKEEE